MAGDNRRMTPETTSEPIEQIAESAARRRYWLRVKRLTGWLLLGWMLVTLLPAWFARDLHALRWFGFPLSFWIASQGALLVYLAIIVVYAIAVERWERELFATSPDEVPVHD
jgi:putative solute:sodium symporter small subunit